MSKPILAVDVDGVISLFGFEERPEGPNFRFELVDGVPHCISLATGDRLRRLGERFELVWATGWEDKANFYLPGLLGLPELPHITFDGAARFGSSMASVTVSPRDVVTSTRCSGPSLRRFKITAPGSSASRRIVIGWCNISMRRSRAAAAPARVGVGPSGAML